jgi:hypothetical protein
MFQLIPADQAATMFEEEKEYLIRLLLELEFPALFPEFGGVQINLKNAETNKSSGMGGSVHGIGVV